MSTQGGSYSWNAICKVCGFQYKGQEMRRRWDGLEPVCQTCWEPRHPLDLFRTRSDFHKLPWQTPAEDITPETGLGWTYAGDPAWTSESASNYTFYNYWWTSAACRPVALRYYHDGLYTQAKSPVTLTLWTKRDFEPTFVLRLTKTIQLLPNSAGWVTVPVTQAETSGLQFVVGDAVTYVIVGAKTGDAGYIPISVAGTVADQTYLALQDSYYSSSDNPNSASSLGSIPGIDVVVKAEADFDDVVYP